MRRPAFPAVGLGTFQLEGHVCERVVGAALDVGYRHFDTAEGYGNEEAIGRALRGRSREDAFLTSKVWRDHLRPDDLRRACEGSLRRLGTDYLDLYLVHWPNRDIPLSATIDGMAALIDAGLIRRWGVSNFTERHLSQLPAADTPVGGGVTDRRETALTNQVEIHPYFPQEGLSAFCAARDIPLTAYSPLARGHVSSDEVLVEIGAHHGKSAPQVALRWLLQRGCSLVVKTARVDRLCENLDVFDFTLSEEEMSRVGSRPRGSRLFDFAWSEFSA